MTKTKTFTSTPSSRRQKSGVVSHNQGKTLCLKSFKSISKQANQFLKCQKSKTDSEVIE